MEANDVERTFAMVQLPDTPDSRLFVELSSHASDLMEAKHALELAVRGLDGESNFAEAGQHLVGVAAIAYCRTMLHSNVRGRLTDRFQLPDDLAETHERIMAYRNRTIAHSQSELAVTYAIGVFEPDSLELRDVMAATVLVPVPDHVVRQFLKFVETVSDLLDQVLEPVRDRLVKSVAEMDRTKVLALAGPNILEKWAFEFDPKTKRARYPTGQTLYWEREADVDGS